VGTRRCRSSADNAGCPGADDRSIPVHTGDIFHYYDVQVWCIWAGGCCNGFWSPGYSLRRRALDAIGFIGNKHFGDHSSILETHTKRDPGNDQFDIE